MAEVSLFLLTQNPFFVPGNREDRPELVQTFDWKSETFSWWIMSCPLVGEYFLL